jgi:hydrogenase maturation factor HypE
MNGSMKEDSIRKFILDYDFSNENWSVNEIKANLKRLLGEEPAIKINYNKDVAVNEISGEAKEITKLASISIVFTDLDDNMKKLEFQLD